MIYPCSGAEAHPDLGIIPGNHTRRTRESGEFVWTKMMKDVLAELSRIRKCKGTELGVDLPKQLIPCNLPKPIGDMDRFQDLLWQKPDWQHCDEQREHQPSGSSRREALWETFGS